ncbi:MAG: hypothetical protein K2W96_01485 [Gemmataceae bacterium]|nr:hypothetical protein [Gemmataceae bacterium]
MRESKDRSILWLLEKHGGALLRLAGVTGFTSWEAAHNVLAYPKRLPDGVIEATFPGQAEPDLFIVEVETYPDGEAGLQVLRDVALVFLARGVVPDAVCLVLAPRREQAVAGEHAVASRLGWSRLACGFRVVELWRGEAEAVLSGSEAGLLPLVPLMGFDGPPKVLMERCRERIEALAPADERENMLAIAATRALFRYNDLDALSALFRRSAMLKEIPLVQKYVGEVLCEERRGFIGTILTQRFGSCPENIAARLRLIDDADRLSGLVDTAFSAASLASFEEALP